MAKALIVYATRTGETKAIAELIAEGLRMEGTEAEVVNVTAVQSESDLEGFEAYVLGSATYHGEMMQTMKRMLFLGEKVNLQNKVGGSFGAFGWSGEAPDRIYDTMKNVFRMNMVGNALRLKSASLGGGMRMAQEYGRDIAKKMK